MKKLLLILTGFIGLVALTGCVSEDAGNDSDKDNESETQEPGGDNDGDNDGGGSDVEGFASAEKAGEYVVDQMVKKTFVDENFTMSQSAADELNVTVATFGWDVKDALVAFNEFVDSYGTYKSHTTSTTLTDEEKALIKTDGGQGVMGDTKVVKATVLFEKDGTDLEANVFIQFSYTSASNAYRLAGLGLKGASVEGATERAAEAALFVGAEIGMPLTDVSGSTNFKGETFVETTDKDIFEALRIGVLNTQTQLAETSVTLTNEADAMLGDDFIYELSITSGQGLFYTLVPDRSGEPDKYENISIKFTVGEDSAGDFVVKSTEVNEAEIVDYYLRETQEVSDNFGNISSMPEVVTKLKDVLNPVGGTIVNEDLDTFCVSYLVNNESTMCADLKNLAAHINVGSGAFSGEVQYDYSVNEMITVTFPSAANDTDEFTIVFDRVSQDEEYKILDFVSPNMNTDIEKALEGYKHDLQTKKTGGTLTFTDIVNSIINPVK